MMIFLKGFKTSNPPEVRSEILGVVHRYHKSVEACLTLARELVCSQTCTKIPDL